MFRHGVWVVVVGLSVLGCVEPKPDPCAAVDCGAGRCGLVAGAPACLCDVGFVADALTCVAIPPADLCASNPCANLVNSLCQQTDGAVRCVCPASRVEVNGACVLRTACLPNPCQHLHRTTCEDVGSVAACRCERGYAPEGDGCSATPVWDCAAQHASGDLFESDECPMQARALVIATDESRTLMPEGDHDWFSLEVTPGRLFSVIASSNTPLFIEVFDSAGLTLLAADNRGEFDAEVTFVAPRTTRVMVRVRGVRVSDTGVYTVRYSDVGVDDYQNVSAGAVTLVPGATPFSGTVQYAGDLDVVWLEMPALTAINLSLLDAGPEVAVEIAGPDGGLRLLNLGESTTITTSTVESLSLTARGRHSRAIGDFSLSFTALGPDDYSDEPVFGTPLVPDNHWVTGTFERPADVDCFTVTQKPGHFYRAHWQGQGPLAPSVGVSLPSGGVPQMLGFPLAVWKTAPSAGPAVLRVMGSVGLPVFSLAVEDLGVDDHGDTATDATRVAVGASVAGRFEQYADVDTFSFASTPGRIVQATATQLASSGGTIVHVAVYDPQGVLVGEADGAVSVQVSTSGVHTVQLTRREGYGFPDLVLYELALTDQGTDDYAGTSVGATSLPLSRRISGAVQFLNDVDAFAVNVVAGHVYAVRCSRGAGNCSLQVRDGVGQVVGSSSTASTLQFFAPASGRWLVEVNSGPSYLPMMVGGYTLEWVDLGLEDHGSTPATATALTLGTAVDGAIDYPQDIDAFFFNAVAGHIYGFGTTLSTSLRLELRDSTNSILAIANGFTEGYVAQASGPLFISASSSIMLSYSLLVTDRGVDDHSDTTTGATALTPGVAVVANIQSLRDSDYFTATLVPGHFYKVTASAQGASTCTVIVFSNSGQQLTPNIGSEPTFKAPNPSAPVFVRVSGSDLARCSVVATDVGLDDHGDTEVDATAVVLDAPPTDGVLQAVFDNDAFSITASAGEIVTVDCATISGSACALVLPPVAFRLQTGPAARTVTAFLAATTGSYVVLVRGSGASVGAYTFAARRGVDDVVGSAALTLGASRNATIDYVGDSDVFSIDLTAGTTVQASLTPGVRASVTFPGGGAGPTLVPNFPYSFVAGVTGTYQFTVETEFSTAELRGYTLRVW